MTKAVSIQRKMSLAVFAAIGTSLLLCAIGLGVFEFKAAENRLRASLGTLADTLLANLVSTVDFEVQDAATDALARLERGDTIVAASLYAHPPGAAPLLFAQYRRAGQTMTFPTIARADGFYVDGDRALLVTTFAREGRPVASLQLEGSLASARRGLGESLRMLGLIFIGLLVAGAVLARILQRSVTEPIMRLAETAHAVRTNGNYALRATVATDDEVGQLAGQFNEMLGGIEARDREIFANHALQRAILNGAGVAVISTDAAGVVRSFNPAAEQLLGYRAVEVIGLVGPGIWHDRAEVAARARELSRRLERPVAEGFEAFVAAIPHGGSDGYEWTYLRKDGRRVLVFLVVSELRGSSGELLGYVGLATDLTERRRREHALQSFSKLTAGVTGRDFFTATVRQLALELGVRYAFVGELLNDPNGTRVVRTLAVWNNGPAANFQYALDGTPCANVAAQGLCHYSDRVAALFPEDKLLGDMSARSYAGVPIRDHTGLPLGLVVVLDEKAMPEVDAASFLLLISATRSAAELQRLRNEEQITHLNADLERRVGDRTVELARRVAQVEQLNQEQQDLMRSLSVSQRSADRVAARLQEANANLLTANQELEAFSYSVSHDLRAPLRNITGFIELLARRSADRLDVESNRFLSVVTTEANRMGMLIDDLLTFSRIGRTEMSLQTVSLAELVAEVRDELRNDISERVIVWNVGPLPKVRGDRALLRQVVSNLLSNAVKFTRKRSPAVIEIGAAPARTDDETVSFFVRDNGAGFNPKYLDKLFGVFQRLHNSRDFEGTGIGLANVKRIVNRHGGRVWADGAADQGATFYFTLRPATEPGASP